MLYKITFTKLDVSANEWLSCFQTIFSVSAMFRMHILIGQRKAAFLIESKKKLDVLNTKLSPLYLTQDFTDHEQEALSAQKQGFGNRPFFMRFPLFEFINRHHIALRAIYRISFGVNKYNPLWLFPVFDIHFEKDGQLRHGTGTSLLHLTTLLAFDLTQSITGEIEKVKPMLAPGIHIPPTFTEGMLQVRYGDVNNKISVRSYDFWRHTIVLGQSGSGKSYLLKLLIEDIARYARDEYSIVLIDPHAFLEQHLRGAYTKTRIDFKETTTNVFVNIGQPTLSTELTIDLFSTVINVHENKQLERVLKFALFALYGTNAMNVENLKNLLTDSVKRKELLQTLKDRSILQFFDTEYQQLYTAHYADAVLPIINILSELHFLNNATQTIELTDAMNHSFLVSIPIKQTELGTNITRVIGGSIIAQIFTIMQAGLVKKKVLLIIDEVSIVQTPSLSHILSEARKFNMGIIMAQQYLSQVSAPILQSIFANAVNYFCFKLSRDDAEIVARNLNFEIDEFFLTNKNDPREVLELGIRIVTELNPREVIARVLSRDQYCSPFKSKTVRGTV
ncbi:DUF87 domain-containing protein [Candidatus Gottesmanbacteria bacterium]|nr:DUF87 domain-containing protein [Candidatus Gottesmanbacteria bacterium]